MALAPGETSESFIREVDENLRRSQAETFFRRWGKLLVAGAILALVAVAALIWWRSQQAEKTAAQSEELAAVIQDMTAGKTRDIDTRLAAISAQDSGGYGGLAQMTGAAWALQNGERAKALATYSAVAADKGQPEEFRNVALLRQTALEFDAIKPDQVIARLQPLVTPGSPWFGTAAEMTAMAMLKQNRRSEAGQLFGKIAADKDVPGSLRARAVQIAGTLGVDATAAMPAAE